MQIKLSVSAEDHTQHLVDLVEHIRDSPFTDVTLVFSDGKLNTNRLALALLLPTSYHTLQLGEAPLLLLPQHSMQEILGGEQVVEHKQEDSGDVTNNKGVKDDLKEEQTSIKDTSFLTHNDTSGNSGVYGQEESLNRSVRGPDEVQRSPMVESVDVEKSLERNLEGGVQDFYLTDYGGGDVRVQGSLSLEAAVEVTRQKLLTRDSRKTSTWLPRSPPPHLNLPIKKVFNRPDALKSAASHFMKWILKPQGLKMGEGDFLGWHYPVARASFLHTDKYLASVSTTFSLATLLPWGSLARLRNGLSSGSAALLNPASGLTSWLAFLRVFVEWCLRMVELQPKLTDGGNRNTSKLVFRKVGGKKAEQEKQTFEHDLALQGTLNKSMEEDYPEVEDKHN